MRCCVRPGADQQTWPPSEQSCGQNQSGCAWQSSNGGQSVGFEPAACVKRPRFELS
jgi:hypothetical protein